MYMVYICTYYTRMYLTRTSFNFQHPCLSAFFFFLYLASRVRQKLQSGLVVLLIICTLSFSNRYRTLKIKLGWKKKLFRRPTRKSIFLHNKFTSLPNYSGICSRNYFGLFSHFWFFFPSFLLLCIIFFFAFFYLFTFSRELS